MSKKVDALIKAYLIEKDYCERQYLSEEESEAVNKIKKYVERERYRKAHGIYVDERGAYFQFKGWDMSYEDMQLLLKIDQNITLNKIKRLLSGSLSFIIFLLVIIGLRACSGY
ncbi:hypothetical protein HZI73_15495 [Vallitalea pronyensis]|uniref:Uncharacterized protein n=1 Tax=Vallitalea pronyensis TaxID=1348613 RepID=A0A8J8SHI3_9FIRM|nr:hypothetical protein [Vallitalea pronyensis]QUI23606.1 hypothetical protein HZI73_15495 [Vallitalea pronyensis]